MRSSSRSPWFIILYAAAGIGGGCDAPDTDAPDLELAPLAALYKASIKNDTLTLTNGASDSKLALRLASATMLAVDVADDGSADFTFDRARFSAIVVDAGGGKDVVRIDESAGAFSDTERVTLRGGAGDDTLIGGIGADTLDGGAGADRIEGSYGVDTIAMGDGDDVVAWSPGGGSDVVDGGRGVDRLTFYGSNASESYTLANNAGRLRLTRDVASIVLDAAGLEHVDLLLFGGSDTVAVDDLGPTTVERVAIDAAGAGGAPDGVADVVTVRGPAGTPIDVAAQGAEVVATSAGFDVRVSGGEPGIDGMVAGNGGRVTVYGTDLADVIDVVAVGGAPVALPAGWNVGVTPAASSPLVVVGMGGADHIRCVGGLTSGLTLLGADGDDVIVGSNAADVIDGGAGGDTIDGFYGADTITGGPGDDTVLWNPGGGSDLVEGGDDHDVMVISGANIGETFDIGGVGDRVRFSRDVGTVTLDAGAVERIELRTLGGADNVTVHDLDGSVLTAVDVDLAYNGAPDTLADTVIVRTAGVARLVADGEAMLALTDGPDVRVEHGDVGLDRLVGGASEVAVEGTEVADQMYVHQVSDLPAVLVNGATIMAASEDPATLTVHGLGGDDAIVAYSSVTTALRLDGGEGDDRVIGGSGADTLLGGPGKDFFDGGYGADAIWMGEGDDIYVWDPGKASDVVEGEGGADVLSFNGSNIGENIELSALGGRVRLTRNVGTVALDLAGIERLQLITRSGEDFVTLDDLGGTGVAEVAVDLSQAIGGGDWQSDIVLVRGTDGPDAVRVVAEGNNVVVQGLATQVRVLGQDTIDTLAVHGLGGADSLTADAAVEWLIWLVLQD